MVLLPAGMAFLFWFGDSECMEDLFTFEWQGGVQHSITAHDDALLKLGFVPEDLIQFTKVSADACTSHSKPPKGKGREFY